MQCPADRLALIRPGAHTGRNPEQGHQPHHGHAEVTDLYQAKMPSQQHADRQRQGRHDPRYYIEFQRELQRNRAGFQRQVGVFGLTGAEHDAQIGAQPEHEDQNMQVVPECVPGHRSLRPERANNRFDSATEPVRFAATNDA